MFTDYSPITNDEVAHIHKTLRHMKVLDTNFLVSDAKMHRYNAGTPVSEEELRAYEEKCGVSLPVDYRSFLNRIGSGTGPGGGLNALNADSDLQSSDFQHPFPYTGKTVLDIPFDEREYLIPGALCLGYYGGYSLTVLVVNGPAYGTVWELEENDADKVYKPSGKTFGQWYAAWLGFLNEIAAPKIQADAIVEPVRPGMRRSELIVLCGPTGGDFRIEPSFDGKYDIFFDNLLTVFSMIPAAIGEQGEDDTVKSLFRYKIDATDWIFGGKTVKPLL